MPGEIRLACRYCDTEQCDGIATIPPDWGDVEDVQSYTESSQEVPLGDSTRSPLDWYTHLGVCPECRKIYG
jgi:hypothetical protein